MRPVLILRHGPHIPAGYLGDALAEAGVAVETVPLYAGAPVPDPRDYSAVVSLGGVMGAYDEARYPFLAAEKRLLAAATGAGQPVLGICLGAQLLADALGGRAYRAPGVEAGHLAVTRTAAGDADPVVRHLDRPTLLWHGDTFDLPPGAALLAETERHPQAFRAGSALAIQAHPEASPEIVKEWVEIEGGDELRGAGVEPTELLAALETARDDGAAMAARLFGSWLADAGLG